MLIKQEIVKKFSEQNNNTGSAEVQIALFTYKIKYITLHLKINRFDYQTRRSLITCINKRKRLLKYLYNTDLVRCYKLIKNLNLKKNNV